MGDIRRLPPLETAMNTPNPHSAQEKAHTPDTFINDPDALKKHHDMPDDPKTPRTDPEHDDPDPSGKRP